MALCDVLGVFSVALWFDCSLFSVVRYTCIGLCRSGRSVACCGSSAVLPVFGSSALCGSVWRLKPFCYVWRSGIPSKLFGLCMGKIKPLHGVSGGGMLGGCSVFPVVPLCGVPGIIALSPFSVLRSVWLRGMVEGGKAVPVVIGGGLWFSVRRAAVLVAAGGWRSCLALTITLSFLRRSGCSQ